MRKTFYDLLEDIKFDVLEEYNNLLYLFKQEYSTGINGYLRPLSEYIEKYTFRRFKYRNGFTSLYDLMETLNIDRASNKLDDLFVFCEFLIAVMPVDVNGVYDMSQCRVIRGNINNILEKTNYELITAQGHNDRYIIVEKNKAATLASQIVEDKEIAFELLEYNHYGIQGNLSKKRSILVSLGAYIEPILKDKTLSNAGYKNLESNAGFLLNKFHIRHNNKEGKTAQPYIINITDEQLENWYDRTYDILIQVIITNENVSVEKELVQLKQEYTWK